MAIVCCCLCLANENHRSKKKLHGLGGSAAKAKDTLTALSPVPIESLQDPEAVLCSKCEKTLTDIKKI